MILPMSMETWDIFPIISLFMDVKMNRVSKMVAAVQLSELFNLIVQLSGVQGARNNHIIAKTTDAAKTHKATAVIR